MRYVNTIPLGPKVAAWVFSALALLFLVIGIIVAVHTNTFIKSSTVTEGEIIDTYKSETRDSDGSTSTSIYAIVKFYDAAGREIIWKANTTSNDAVIIGEKVKMRYEVDNPKNASYDNCVDIWFAVILMGIFFIFFGGFGVAFIYSARKSSSFS